MPGKSISDSFRTSHNNEISFEKLKATLQDERPADLKTALRDLPAELCFNLENLTDDIITKEVTRDIDRELKTEG